MAQKDKNKTKILDESSKSEILHRLKTQPFLFIGTILILVIVIVAFVFVPAIVPNRQSGGDLVFGYYNKVPVKYVKDNYFYQVQQYLTRNQQQTPDDPGNIYTYYRIWRQAYEETVVHMGILDATKQAGYVVPNDVVDRNVAELPQFQENGKFSAVRYRALDKNSQMTLWRQIQDSAAANIYLSDLSGLKVSSNESAFISTMASPRRSFELAVFPFSTYPDSGIISYAEANPALFRVIHLSKITITSGEREARQVLDSVKNGTLTFEEAARTSSADAYADKGGDMGIMMAHEFTYEISDAEEREKVMGLSRGEMSDLIQVSSGWAFYRAEESSNQADLNDPSQIQKIRTYIMIYLRGQVEDWLFEEAEKFSALAKSEGFDAAIEAGNVTKQSFGPIPVNYGNAALFSSVSSTGVQEIASAGTNQLFWKAAFSTPLNTPSNPLVIGENVLVLYPLEESDAEENDIQIIEMYYPYWISSGTEQAYRNHFLSSEKFDDRFDKLFWDLWGVN